MLKSCGGVFPALTLLYRIFEVISAIDSFTSLVDSFGQRGAWAAFFSDENTLKIFSNKPSVFNNKSSLHFYSMKTADTNVWILVDWKLHVDGLRMCCNISRYPVCWFFAVFTCYLPGCTRAADCYLTPRFSSSVCGLWSIWCAVNLKKSDFVIQGFQSAVHPVACTFLGLKAMPCD